MRALRRTVEVPPASTVTVPLLQPAVPMWAYQLRVRIDGRMQQAGIGLPGVQHGMNYYYGGGYGGASQPVVLAGREISSDVIDEMNGAFERVVFSSGGRYYGRTGSPIVTRSDRPASEWSDNWLAYTRWDAVMLTPTDWKAMSPPTREALLSYRRAGGHLTFVGGVPPVVQTAEHGFGGTDNLVVPAHDNRRSDSDALRDDMTRWDDARWRNLYNAWQVTTQPWHGYTPQQANDTLPVIDELGIPARGMLLLMFLFAVTVGPVNLFVLKRLDRRVWLLWTAPLLALLFSAAVFGYAIIAEGWHARGQDVQLTLLDQRDRLATTLAWTGYYAPLTPSGGLTFDPETEVTPLLS